MCMPELPSSKPKPGSWVQTDRSSHEAWAALAVRSPKAGALLHILAARVGEHNAVVCSQQTLADIMGCSRETVKRALKELQAGLWVEVRRIGKTGSINAYVLNSRVVWSGPRDELRRSLFYATVIASDNEQPDQPELGQQEPLRTLPRLYPEEQQLPSGAGLDPPSEPSLPGMDPDMPSLSERDDGEARPIGDYLSRFEESSMRD